VGRLPALLAENACPDTLICETFTAAVPWFTTETVVLVVVPVATAPKPTEFGVACRDPAFAVATGAPISCPPRHPHSASGKQHESKMKIMKMRNEHLQSGCARQARE